MTQITFITVGSLKESYLLAAIAEYKNGSPLLQG